MALLDDARDADRERDPAGFADRRWADSVVRTMVSELPEVERHVVALAYSDGLSQSAIAVLTVSGEAASELSRN